VIMIVIVNQSKLVQNLIHQPKAKKILVIVIISKKTQMKNAQKKMLQMDLKMAVLMIKKIKHQKILSKKQILKKNKISATYVGLVLPC
jgi:hypothetical protein